jgi:sugar/nucleoside kinase (ribokinase family)
VFVNGFVFDDLEPETVVAAVRVAQAGGADVFFDAGPRARALQRDVPAGGAAVLRELLAISDAVMLTQDEAEVLTGLADADEARASGVCKKRARLNCCMLTRAALRPSGARRPRRRCWRAARRRIHGLW